MWGCCLLINLIKCKNILVLTSRYLQVNQFVVGGNTVGGLGDALT